MKTERIQRCWFCLWFQKLYLFVHNILLFQVQKAQIEKAEIKADMTKERLQPSQDLLLERERAKNLEETVRLLKEQAQIYQVEASSNTIIWPEFSWVFFSQFSKTFISAADGGAAGWWCLQQQELPALQNPDRQAHQVDDPAREGHRQLEAEI